jgi:hypothetical protein
MITLHEDAWAVVTLDEASDLVRYTRTSRRYADIAELQGSFAAVGHVLRTTRASRILIDVRLAPPRNDEDFESNTNAAVQRLTQRFDKIVLLVQTAVGRLQVHRMASHRGQPANVFTSERDALDFLAR